MGKFGRNWGMCFENWLSKRKARLIEGYLMADHVHILSWGPPKYSVAQVMGCIKGKSAIHIARVYAGRRRNFVGQYFWATGYWVSTVDKNEAAVRCYIQDQKKEAEHL
jgi:putative transposase